jgi:cytochrome c5
MWVRKITLFLFLTISLFAAGGVSAEAYKVVDNSEKMVEQRLTPPGAGLVTIDQTAPPIIAAANAANISPGQKTYETYCVVCHGAGVAGAPKKGDQAAWKKRLDEGWAVVLARAMKGYNAMPPKGTCATCTEADLKAAVEFMTH